MPNTQEKKKKPHEQLEHGKASLERMMETLQPFLPKLNLEREEPAEEWELASEPSRLGCENNLPPKVERSF